MKIVSSVLVLLGLSVSLHAELVSKKIDTPVMSKQMVSVKQDRLQEIVSAVPVDLSPVPQLISGQMCDKPVGVATPMLKTPEPTTHQLKVYNRITDKMTTYTKHWSGNHTPKWHLKINNSMIESGLNRTIKMRKKILTLEFYFEFWALGKLQRKGTITAKYSIAPCIKGVIVTFDWDKEERLVVKNKDAKPQAVQPRLVSFQEKE